MQDSRPFGSPVLTLKEQKLIDLKDSTMISPQNESNDNKTTASSNPENLNWYVAAFEDNPQSSSTKTLMHGPPLGDAPSEAVSRPLASASGDSDAGPLLKRVMKVVCDGKYLAGVATATVLALIFRR
jgi:hypothetical protein